MAERWKIVGKKSGTEGEYINACQSSTTNSRINLEQRFGIYSAPGNEHHYENWNGCKPSNGNLMSLQKIYENQQEMLDCNMLKQLPSRCFSKEPPPLPPRNTPIRTHPYDKSILVNASTSITSSHNMFTDNIHDDNMEKNTDVLVTHYPSTRKSQSRSSSALPRFSIRRFSKIDKHTFNQTFSVGDNIYNNLSEEGDDCGQQKPSFKNLQIGIGPLWDSVQGNIKEGKPHTSKLFKLSSHKLGQAVQGCRTAFASISQKFRSSTQRRYRLDSSSPRGCSIGTPPRGSIRRTPGKMYSPFTCCTPPPPRSGTKRLCHHHSRVLNGQENRILKNLQTRSVQVSSPHCHSPSRNNFAINVEVFGDERKTVHSWLGVAPRHGGGPCTTTTAGMAQHEDDAADEVHFGRGRWNSSRQLQRADECVMSDIEVRPLLQDGCSSVGKFNHRNAVKQNINNNSQSFQRHLVEFDQISRNLTVSLARNSRFRNSVR